MTAMGYESIIEAVGGFGRYHLLIFIAISLGDIFSTFALTLPLYVNFTPDWTCDDDNGTYFNVSKNTSQENLCERCHGVKKSFLSETVTIVTEWNLVCDLDFVGDLITSIQLLGLTLGAFIFAQVSDSFGRKKVQFSTIILMSFAGIVSSFSVNWQMFAGLRFVTGVGVGGYVTVNSVYGMEFVSRRWRILCGVLGWWSATQFVLAGMAYLLENWRHLTLACGVLGFFYIVFWWFLPESPRWLAQKQRFEEAEKIFKHIAKKNKRPVPDLRALQETKDVERTFTYLDLFRRRDMFRRTLCAIWLWFSLFLLFFEIFYSVTSLSGNRYVNAIIGGLMDLGSLLTCVFSANRLGRKNLIHVGVLVTLISNLVLLSLTSLDLTGSLWSNVVAQVGRYAVNTSVYGILVYGAEIYPTSIRNLGVGVGQVAARIGSLCAPQIMYLGRHYRHLPYILMSVLCLLVFPFYWLLPETSGHPLVDDYSVKTIVVADKEKDGNQNPTEKSDIMNHNEDNSKL